MGSHKPFASSPAALIALGLAFLLGAVTVVGAALLSATGAFSGDTGVTARVIATGSQVRAGAPVKFREVTIGEVEAVLTPGRSSAEPSRLELSIDDDRLAAIPANVTARVAPASLFGENVVELVPPSAASGQLHSGAEIAADVSSTAVQMSEMFDSLKRIVDVMQPAKLQSVLGTMAQVLDGRGPQLGRMAARLNRQLALTAEEMPLIRTDVAAVTHFIDGLSTATPDLLRAAQDTVVVTRELLAHREQIRQLIHAAQGLASRSIDFLVANGASLVCTIRIGAGLADLLHDHLGTYGAGLTNGIRSLENFIRTFSKGPWAGVSVELSGTLSQGLVPPPAYGPQDRTRFPGGPGPTCAGDAR